MSNHKIRWGILGAGVIAHKLANAVQVDPDSELVAVASRTPEKAESFAAAHDISACSYEALVSRDDIDVVYVATTHNFHYENALLALNHDKHVLVEKPFTVNEHEARLLINLAKDKSLFLMEALWVRYLPSIQRLRQVLENGVIGEVKLINIIFGGIAPPEYQVRMYALELAGGVTLDMGVYPITLANFLLGELPIASHSFCNFSDSGVDELASYQLKYASGCIATINTSFNLHTRQAANIYGSLGFIEFPQFQQGQEFTVHTHNGTREIMKSETIREDHHENGFCYQVAEVVRCLRQGLHESPVMPLEETANTMALMDGFRREWAFVYPFESPRATDQPPHA